MVRIPSRGLVLSANDVFHHPSDWLEISRDEAVFAAWRDRVVIVFRKGPTDCADWFEPTHPFLCGVGPHSLRHVRYFRYLDRPVPRPQIGGGGGGAAVVSPPPVERRPPRAPARAGPPQVKQKTWIEIELLDDDGAPVANERYTIRVPDGSTREGKLDANGRARVDDIDPGTCDVSFPEIEAREWRPA